MSALTSVSPLRRHLDFVRAPAVPEPAAVATASHWRRFNTRVRGGRDITTFVRTDGTTIRHGDKGWYGHFVERSGFADYIMECDGEGGDSGTIMHFVSAEAAMAYIDRGWALKA